VSYLLVFLGGTVTVDGGAGLREVLDELPLPTTAACDVSSPLLDAAYVFARQKGATEDQLGELAERLRGLPDVPGSGAAGGLGGAFAALGAELVPGAPLVLDELGFDPRGYDLVVTGEGVVDETTWAGKAPGEVARRCREAGVRYVNLYARRPERRPRARSRGSSRARRAARARRLDEGRTDSTRFASSSIFPCAESRSPTQSLHSTSPRSHRAIAASSEIFPCSSRVTICSSSRSRSSNDDSSVNGCSEGAVRQLDVPFIAVPCGAIEGPPAP
jgi:hypothetical protein